MSDKKKPNLRDYDFEDLVDPIYEYDIKEQPKPAAVSNDTYRYGPQSCLKEPKPAAIQSADELRRYALDTTRGEVFEIAKGAYCLFDDVQKAFAAQRQAGREEVQMEAFEASQVLINERLALDADRKYYSAVVEAAIEAMDERRAYCDAWEWKYKERWDKEDADMRKALDEARKG